MKIHMGREIVKEKTKTEGKKADNPPGTNRDLGTGWGRQGGKQNDVGYVI